MRSNPVGGTTSSVIRILQGRPPSFLVHPFVYPKDYRARLVGTLARLQERTIFLRTQRGKGVGRGSPLFATLTPDGVLARP